MENLLKEANKRYERNSLFLSATGNLSKPLRVTTLRMSEVYKNTVVDSNMGVIYDYSTNTWAKKVNI